MPFFNTRL
ncbi:hypothetical protein SS209_03467 [Salmonella enterica subsp. enterica serovar Senftenberg str. SS209]|nr:hypothetical protein SS209_03467 [Salmonella enterica subsp. enterica serovar Senftenberg str. SS209]